MAKNINHIQHIKSSVVEDGKPKLPSSSVLVEGEIAVNFAKDVETLSIKNASGEVVTFSSDNYYTEKKLGSGFTGDNSGKTVTEAIDESEQVTAAALNDLNERKMDASAYTPTDLTGYATEEWVDGRLGSGFTDEFSARTVTEVIEKNEKVVAASLNDLNTRKLDASAYTPTDLTGYATETWVGDRLGSGFTGANSATTVTEGIEDLEAWIEDKLGSGFTGENSANTVTSVIEDNEEAISAALNDLNERKMDTSAYTPTDLTGYATELWVGDKLGSGFTGENSANTVTGIIEENEEITSAALNDLDGRVSPMENSVSSHTSNTEIHVTQSDKTLWNGVATKENRMPIETVATGTTALTAVVGTYYTLSNVGTINITLPVPTDGYVNTIVFYIVTGSANPSISMISTASIKYQENYNFDASSTYEVNALYNGIAWVIAFMKLS